MKWNNAEVSLPVTHEDDAWAGRKVSGPVLVFDEVHEFQIAFVEEDAFENCYDWVACGITDNHLLKDVVGWMPLPEPPKEEGKKEPLGLRGYK